MVITVKPNAKATPTKPIPSGKFVPSPIIAPLDTKVAARTALPQPPRTNQNVPINSAIKLLDDCMLIFNFTIIKYNI